MKIREILNSGTRSISFEFFPPQTDQGTESLFNTIQSLRRFRPNYVSVTYGAGGSTRDKTLGIVSRIKDETDQEVMCHVTCVGQTKEDVHNVLARLHEAGIENVLGLRGDPPRGQEKFVPAEGGFLHSADLIAHIQANFDFGIGAACFPEGHLDSVDLNSDMDYLEKKVASGADFLVTQLFFDNNDFHDFMDRVEQTGIRVPIIAGILPILSTPQIRRFTALCGAKIPSDLNEQLDKFADNDDAVRDIGIDHATKQVAELWRDGVAGVHLYTLNRSYSVSCILDQLAIGNE